MISTRRGIENSTASNPEQPGNGARTYASSQRFLSAVPWTTLRIAGRLSRERGSRPVRPMTGGPAREKLQLTRRATASSFQHPDHNLNHAPPGQAALMHKEGPGTAHWGWWHAGLRLVLPTEKPCCDVNHWSYLLRANPPEEIFGRLLGRPGKTTRCGRSIQ
jgi:hypothetical protein